MYMKITIALLLSGCVSVTALEVSTIGDLRYTSTAVPSSIASILDESDITTQETTVSVSPGAAAVTDGSISETSTWISSGLAASSQTSVSAVSPHPPFPETREQLEHIFSEPVIIVIVFGVMAGIFGTIFAIYACINQLTKKRPVDIQPPTLQDTDVPLSSVETGLPEQ
ncbi:glycophorin-A isoform X1 [Castor canadensis]|uniref:Glycophorin-A n=1 Tax=Castor canadensis TaxID=51338 RepID=A0A8B7VGT4_CASCN|nr:glycophorin-A isoform X2 [Castor canadensis]